MVVTEPGCDSTISGQMWPHQCDDESSNSSSDQQKYNNHMGRKRKAPSSFDEDHDDRQTKKVKNREAARRCREKKQRQTEELRKKNQELERDNCHLAKQKDELIQMCRKYQLEIEQHKDQGCMVPHFDPPFNIDSLLNSDTPPSPSLSVSTHSESASPSHTPSVSPGPPPRQMTYRSDVKSATAYHHEADTLQTGTVAANPDAAAATPTQQMHDLLVRKQDGTISKLRLTHEDYKKVMQRLKVLKEKQKDKQQQQLQQGQEKRQPPSLATFQSTSQPQKQMPFLPQLPHDPPVSTGMTQSLMEAQENRTSTGGQKLNTTDYNDIISVLQNNVKELGNFDLTPVNPNEVLSNPDDLSVKQEPMDNAYDLGFGEVEIKQEVAEQVQAEIPSGQWSSTGEHIRAGMDTLTQQELPASSSQNIQNIVQYLEHNDDNEVFTVTISDPKTSNVLDQTIPRSASMKVTRRSDDIRRIATTNSSPSNQTVMYVTSSAQMGSLGAKVPTSNRPIEGAKPRAAMSVSTMPNIKIRPNATAKLTPLAPDSLGVMPQMTHASISQNDSRANPGTASETITAWNSRSSRPTTSQDVTFTINESQESQAIDAAQLFLEQHVSGSSVPQTSLADSNVLIVSSPNASSTESENLVSSFSFCINNFSIEAMASKELNQ